MAMDHGRHIVRFAEGRAGNLVKCENRSLGWGDFCKRLGEARRDRITTKQFLDLPLQEQGRLKGADGWFVGGPVDGGRRNRQAVRERDLLTFDIDDCAPRIYCDLRDGVSPLSGYEFFLHPTRKHTEEKPRFRVVMPLLHPVPAFQYEPLMRIAGAMLDPTLDGIDDVTFRAAQLMYWPTISRDSLWEPFRNRGALIDSETVLDSFGEWRDFKNLPFSEKRSKGRRKAEKAENPLGKRGVLGAFNRAYSVEEAIAEFLPEVYIPGDDSGEHPRYTYAAGSVANGAIVYDDGLFLYSHHDTDPAGHQNLNAFDLVRVHRFGHLDDKIDKEETPPSKWPSFKKMEELALELEEVRGELVQDQLDMVAIFDDLDDKHSGKVDALKREHEEPEVLGELEHRTRPGTVGLPPFPGARRPEKPKKGWERQLQLDQFGNIRSTVWNIVLILMNDPRLHGAIGRNRFSNRICALRPIKTKMPYVPSIDVDDPEDGLGWIDDHDVTVRMILEAPRGSGRAGYGLKASERDLRDGITQVANNFEFHPLINRLISLPAWDGTRRAETLWIDYMGSPDTPYYRETARQFLLGAVARVFWPGHKFDFVPVFSGAEGKRKTTFVQALAFDKYGGELSVDMDGGKDAVEQIQGKWIVEVAELASLRRSEIEGQKAFISRTVDRVRLAYDRRMSEFRRQAMLMGTANEFEYLKHRENRRFWPIRVILNQIDTDKLRENVDQIWAEVMTWYRNMLADGADYRRLTFGLTGAAAEEARRLQAAARIETADDQEAAKIERWLNTPIPLSELLGDPFGKEDEPLVVRVKTCSMEIAEKCLGEKLTNRQQKNQTAVSITNAFRLAGSGLEATWAKYSELNGTDGKLLISGYGQQRAFVRRGVTRAELAVGYRVVADSIDGKDVL